MITNPILPGFNPDPCICRKDDDFYLAVSTFEWMPGIPVYHSRDLKHWELYTHVLTDDANPDLKGLPSSKGIWAPCLTYCEEEKLFYVVYGVMHSMNARNFDIDNYLVTAADIRGPWSRPVYLHSSGFDASIFHDNDGRKYVVALDWETREGYEKPGAICMAEYLPDEKRISDYPKRIWRGGTDRGCIEAPHLTRRGDYYYIMCAEGGTGYNHSVTMGRSVNPWGPYEGDPANPIVTSAPGDPYERDDPDHLKPKYYNPASVLQKSGHGSYVNLDNNEAYLVHLTARPFVPELRCTLGRETAIQKMKWTDDGWLRMYDGSNLAKEEVPEPSGLPAFEVPALPEHDDFEGEELAVYYYAPRIMPQSFADIKSRPGYVRIRGHESLTSLNRVSLLARKLTALNVRITAKMDFRPKVHQHSAGLVLYYDNMDFIYLRKYYSETLKGGALSIIKLENGEKEEYPDTRTAVGDGELYLRLLIEGRELHFEWSTDGEEYKRIGGVFDISKLSDEYCRYGEFTGTMAGIACEDTVFHRHYADFDLFDYEMTGEEQ